MKDLKSYNLSELTMEMKNIGEKAFRAKQIYDWMHVKLVSSVSEMKNLPMEL